MVSALFVAPHAVYLPKTAMAVILFPAACGLIDFGEMRHILTSSKRETAVLSVTLYQRAVPGAGIRQLRGCITIIGAIP